MLSEQRKANLILHICVFIWGFTAILGNLITLKETVLVWYRMGITTLSLLVLPVLWKTIRSIPAKAFWQIAGIGILVALHWITFYGSIKYSVVSVALTCLATISFFTAFLEPWLLKTPFQVKQVLLAAAVIPAIYLLFYFTGEYTTGIIMGLISAFLAALFTVFNKKMVMKYNAVSVTFVELSSGFIFMCAILPPYLRFSPDTTMIPSTHDILYLLILSIVCTSIPFVLSLNTLRYLSAFTSNIAVNLEPVYGILMASLLFKDYEQLDAGFYAGTAIILAVLFINSFILKKQKAPL